MEDCRSNGMHLVLEGDFEVEKIKDLVINPRIEKLRSTGSVHDPSVHFLTIHVYVGTIKEIRDIHEFEDFIQQVN